ncbi:hypothetical protein E5288_WYG016897 [Bos mutus]|uniref:Uncharacterized protein n=1 Tax=Bos mutus TaxID=72004 RepID=A0A6B0RVD4_9CETA|nr:hypothetical protein [Bos mutus]
MQRDLSSALTPSCEREEPPIRHPPTEATGAVVPLGAQPGHGERVSVATDTCASDRISAQNYGSPNRMRFQHGEVRATLCRLTSTCRC